MSAQIVPQDFYVYVHRKATTGEIFYVGKGHGKRAWSSDNRNRHWVNIVEKHGRKVEIVQDGLLEWAALELECALIALHGRKDLHLGPLVNMTDGGDGVDAQSASKNAKSQWSDPDSRATILSALNAWRPVDHMEKMRAAASKPEAMAKRAAAISRARKGKPLSEKARLALVGKPVWNQTAVFCLQTGVVFASGAKAAKFANALGSASAHRILQACVTGKVSYGYTWRYATPEEISAYKPVITQ